MEAIKHFLKHNFIFITIVAILIFMNTRYSAYFIKTGSMEPSIKTGALVLIDEKSEPNLKDIFAYKKGGVTVIHRIIEETDDGYVFKGDANLSADSCTVLKSDLIGKVVLTLNFVAPLSNALMSN